MAQVAEAGGGIYGARTCCRSGTSQTWTLQRANGGAGLKPGMHTISQQEAEHISPPPHAHMSPHTQSALEATAETVMIQKKNKSPKIITRGCRPRQGLLKTSDKHVLQFHFKKVSQKSKILSNTFWSSLSGELCWFTGKTWRRKSSTHFTFLHRS